MAFSNRYFGIAWPDLRLTEERLHIYSIENGNTSKTLMAIQWSNQKLRLFRTVTLVRRDQTSASPSSDSTSPPTKTAFGNSCKNLRRSKLSDQKLMPFRTVTLVERDQTSASPRSGSTSPPTKTASGNSCKNMRAIQRLDQKLWPFWTVTLV
jgi:hypothetical protein